MPLLKRTKLQIQLQNPLPKRRFRKQLQKLNVVPKSAGNFYPSRCLRQLGTPVAYKPQLVRHRGRPKLALVDP